MSNEQTNDEVKLTGSVMDDSPPPPAPNPVDEAIGMEARIMLKSIRIPKERPIPEGLRKDIRETVSKHRELHKLTYREIAKQIGFAESTISEVLKGTYTRANPDPVLERLNVWVDDDERRRQKARPIGFYPTCVFETIQVLARYAKSNARVPDSSRLLLGHDLSRMAMGYGPAGCGKTLGAKALHAEDPLSILVRITESRGTASGLARLITEAGGWVSRSQQRSNIDTIESKLKDSGRLLIVDEAHRLKTSGCELLRDLADVCGIPILLLATQEFYERLTRVRTRSGSFTYDQFTSRVGKKCDLIRGVDGKGGKTRPIYSIDEVRGMFNLDKVRLTHDGEDYLQALACAVGFGMLRLASDTWEKALRSAQRGKRIVDAKLLQHAAKSALIPAGEDDTDILEKIDKILAANLAARELQERKAMATG